VEEFLSQRGIEFSERNVAEDKSVLDELEQPGVFTTPVTVIDGEVVIGFDRGGWGALLSGEEVSDDG
jgi:glutaredoxin